MNSESVIRNLKLLFYVAFAIQIAFFVSFAFKWINILPDSAFIPVFVERYALLITLIAIPGALKLFSVIMNKNKHPEDKDYTTALYIKAFIARFGILFLVASLNIVLYAFSLNQNFMLCTLITLTAYIFSYPSTNYQSVYVKKEGKPESAGEQK